VRFKQYFLSENAKKIIPKLESLLKKNKFPYSEIKEGGRELIVVANIKSTDPKWEQLEGQFSKIVSGSLNGTPVFLIGKK
jgi:hypothetical protein